MSVFLLTLNENLAFYCADSASRYIVKDFMLDSFEGGVMPLLDLLTKLISLADPEVGELVNMGGPHPTFSLSWILTWFSHDL